MSWAMLEGFWSDAGTFESLYRTGAYWARRKLGEAPEALLRDFSEAASA
jgi:hypothetical protein